MIFSKFASTLRWLAAWRWRPVASAPLSSARVVSACWRWTGKNSTAVWKSGHVRQALQRRRPS